MAKLLGNVLYWTACGLAALALLIGAYSAIMLFEGWSAGWPTSSLAAIAMASLIAVVIWLIGAACRTVLSGPTNSSGDTT